MTCFLTGDCRPCRASISHPRPSLPSAFEQVQEVAMVVGNFRSNPLHLAQQAGEFDLGGNNLRHKENK